MYLRTFAESQKVSHLRKVCKSNKLFMSANARICGTNCGSPTFGEHKETSEGRWAKILKVLTSGVSYRKQAKYTFFT
jgi:hypothetical protein